MGVKVTWKEYIRLTQEAKEFNYDKPLHDGFTFGKYPVLRRKTEAPDYTIDEIEWGLIPSFYSVDGVGSFDNSNRADVQVMREQYQMNFLNAKSENLLALPVWRQAARTGRCLVLCTGFFEWRHIYPLNKRTGKPSKTAQKIPYHIYLPEDTPEKQPAYIACGDGGKTLFAMAGIAQQWEDVDTGEIAETFALVTTEAPEGHMMAQIHNDKKRMPTILTKDLANAWLFDNLSDKDLKRIAHFQYPSHLMAGYPIDKLFKEKGDPLAPFVYDMTDLTPLENAAPHTPLPGSLTR